TPRFLRKYRRHAIVIILIIAAILTPSPDPFNQLVVAVPIYILYEISIIIAAISIKKYYQKEETEE
ncbi:MAG: twin-arginine translocase subunit TatC, partial [Candidatus Kapaibacterium sp.]